MLLRQDRFHIHPILCAKIVQGERKRKELVHFLFPSRSLYYLTLEISGRSRISPNAIIPCVQAPPHHRPLRRVSAATPLSLACRDGAATCMPPTNLRSMIVAHAIARDIVRPRIGRILDGKREIVAHRPSH